MHAPTIVAVTTSPPAEGVRLPWQALPAPVHDWVAEAAGAGVASVRSIAGGFSPGVAARVRLVDGREVFVKAVGSEPNEQSPELHRREARVTALISGADAVPDLLSSYDDGAWVGLMFRAVPGRQPRLPWDGAELARVLAALDCLHDRLTPGPDGIEPAAVVLDDTFDGWRRLAAEAPGEVLDRMDPWIARHLSRLADLEPSWAQACAGRTVLHLDLRADNILVGEIPGGAGPVGDDRADPEGGGAGVWFVDWPSAGIGAPFLDLVGMAPSVRMQGGPEPDDLLARSRNAGTVDADRVTAAVLGLAGYFTDRRWRPAPPGLPTVREFQAAQGEVALGWLKARTGWA